MINVQPPFKIKQVEFVGSAFRPADFPETSYPEIAFAGRSNAGKSSVLNRLLGRKRLARVSSRPGFTQSINFFLINQKYHFVDLPGYGYAKAPKAVQQKWKALIENYLENRKQLRAVVVIVDIRRGLQAMDLMLVDYLNSLGIPPIVVLNKADKLSQSKRKRALMDAMEVLPRQVEEPLIISAKSGLGSEALLTKIFTYLNRNQQADLSS